MRLDKDRLRHEAEAHQKRLSGPLWARDGEPGDDWSALLGDKESVLAHWESRSGKHWLTLLKGPQGYRYEAQDSSRGWLRADDDLTAIAQMERRLSEFQPDKAKTPMRRVDPYKESQPKCSICRKPAGTNLSCDRCASFRRMVAERDNPTVEQKQEKAEWQREFQRQQQAQAASELERRMRLSGRKIKVGLVGCGKTKLDHAAAARDLYVSPLFRAARRFGERCCDEWVILSAAFGVLLPTQVIDPYEKALGTMRLREREAWADRVTNYLRQHYAGLDVQYIGLAGEDYLTDLGVSVERPLDGLGLGERIRLLTELASDCPTARSAQGYLHLLQRTLTEKLPNGLEESDLERFFAANRQELLDLVIEVQEELERSAVENCGGRIEPKEGELLTARHSSFGTARTLFRVARVEGDFVFLQKVMVLGQADFPGTLGVSPPVHRSLLQSPKWFRGNCKIRPLRG